MSWITSAAQRQRGRHVALQHGQLAGQMRMLVQRKVRVQQETAGLTPVGPFTQALPANVNAAISSRKRTTRTAGTERSPKKASKGTDGSLGSRAGDPPARQAADEVPRARPRPKRGDCSRRCVSVKVKGGFQRTC